MAAQFGPPNWATQEIQATIVRLDLSDEPLLGVASAMRRPVQEQPVTTW